jgi:hypothetical protein
MSAKLVWHGAPSTKFSAFRDVLASKAPPVTVVSLDVTPDESKA